MKRIQIFMPEETLARIDAKVGRGSRSEFIRSAVDSHLRGRKVEQAKVPKRTPIKRPEARGVAVIGQILDTGPKTLAALVKMSGQTRGEVLGELGRLGAKQRGEVWSL